MNQYLISFEEFLLKYLIDTKTYKEDNNQKRTEENE